MEYAKKIEETFIDLARINSVSGSEEHLIDYLSPKLGKLGFAVTVDSHKNLFAKNFTGKSTDSLLLSAHLDTTESTSGINIVKEGNIIRTDGSTILGADNKAAIAEILVALEKLSTEGIKRDIEVIFSSGEEAGLKGIKLFDIKKINSKTGLTLDCCREFGNVVLAAPGAYVVTILVKGKARHGSDTAKGINSIEIAAKGIATFREDSEKIISNFGVINGGTTPNTVPEETTVIMSFRSFYPEESKIFIEKLKDHFQKVSDASGAVISFDVYEVGKAYRHKSNDAFIEMVTQVTKKIEPKTKSIESFGLTDANYLNGFGIKTVEIGYGVSQVHTRQEEADLVEMQKTVDFLVELLQV